MQRIVLWQSTFFMGQLSHPYMTSGKTIALIIWTFVSKVMSLLFNTRSTFLLELDQLPEFTQTHVHRVSDAIQTSHPLSSPSPPDPNPSQHQGLFEESILHIRWPKYWSFSFSIIPSKGHPGLISLQWTGSISLQSKGLSRVFSNTTAQNDQFFSAQPSWSNSHTHT